MANSEEKVSKFVQAITAYAEEQRDKILREAEAFKIERLQKAEQDVLVDAYKLIQQETSEIRNESVREMSRRDLAARKEVLGRRRHIMDEVFAKAEKKLVEYTATPDYLAFMKDNLKQMAEALPAEGTVYSIAGRDEPLIGELSSLCPAGSRVEVSDDVKIGGIRAANAANGQIIDNTLDSRLQSQHEWFTITSGLTVG
jgi:V/A-type H+-transporting ATPase subunit E